jgi:hypothetical protein
LGENGFEALAVEGAKSQYDVVADGRVLFSKEQEGRFPDHDEIIAALKPAGA